MCRNKLESKLPLSIILELVEKLGKKKLRINHMHMDVVPSKTKNSASNNTDNYLGKKKETDN